MELEKKRVILPVSTMRQLSEMHADQFTKKETGKLTWLQPKGVS
jgi:hypothetical protein